MVRNPYGPKGSIIMLALFLAGMTTAALFAISDNGTLSLAVGATIVVIGVFLASIIGRKKIR